MFFEDFKQSFRELKSYIDFANPGTGVFESAGLPYFNPHSFRNTLVRLGEGLQLTPEEFKAWSQNLGHEGVLTTFCSYGEVQTQRQAEIFKQLKTPRKETRCCCLG